MDKVELPWSKPDPATPLDDREIELLFASLRKGEREGNVFTRYYTESQIKYIKENVNCAIHVIRLENDRPSSIWCVIGKTQRCVDEEVSRI